MMDNLRKKAVLAWLTCCHTENISDFKKLSDGKLFHEIIQEYSSKDFSSDKKDFGSICTYLDEFYNTSTASLIDFDQCQTGNDEQLLYLTVLILSSLSWNNKIQEKLFTLDEEHQLQIKIILEIIFESQNTSQFSPDFHKLFSDTSIDISKGDFKLHNIRFLSDNCFDSSSKSSVSSPMSNFFQSPKVLHKRELQEKDLEIRSLRSHLNSERNRCGELEAKFSSQLDNCNKKINELSISLENAHHLNDAALKDYCTFCKVKDEEIDNGQINLRDASIQCRELNAEISLLKEENKQLQKQFDEASDKLSKHKMIYSENIQLKGQNSEYNTKILQLSSAINELKVDNENITAEFKRIQQENESLWSELKISTRKASSNPLMSISLDDSNLPLLSPAPPEVAYDILLEAKVKDLEQVCKNLSEQLETVSGERNSLKSELSDAIKDLSPYSGKCISLKLQVDNILTLIRNLQNDLHTANENHSSSVLEIKKLIEENEKLLLRISEAEKSNATLKADFDTRNAELGSTNDRLNTDLANKINQLAVMKSDKIQIESELHASQEQVVKLTNFNFELEQQVAQLSPLEAELVDLKKSFAKSECINSSLNKELTSLNEKAVALSDQLNVTSEELAETKLCKSDLMNKLDVAVLQIDEISEEKTQKEAELSNTLEQLFQFDALKSENVSIKNELSTSKKQISKLTQDIAGLKDELTSKLTESNKLNDELKDDLTSKIKEIGTMKSNKIQMESELQASQEQVTKLTTLNVELKQEITQLSHFESELTDLKKSFADSETMNSSLNAEILSLNRKADVLTNQLQLSGDELAEVKLRESILIDKYGTSLKQIDEINKEKAQKEAELSNAVEQLHKFNDMKMEKISVENELCISKQKISELMECNACLKADLAAQISHFESELTNLKKSFADSETINSSLNAEILSLNRKADVLTNQLQLSGDELAEVKLRESTLIDKYGTSLKQIDEINKEKAQKEAELSNAVEQLHKFNDMEMEKVSVENELCISKQKISELMECNACLKADLAAQLSHFESELTDLKKSFADSETMNSSLNAEILSLNRKADVLTNQLQLSGDELAEVKLRESTLIDKYSTSLKQIDEINKERAQKEAELSNAVEQLHKFNDMEMEKVSVENELCISKQKISELMECNACLKADLAAQLSHFESELTDLKKSFADSETMNSSLNAEILSLNRKADVLTNQLQLSGDELAEVKLRESTLIDKYSTSLKQIDEINKERAQKEAELSNAVEQLHKFNDMKMEKVSVENELCISKQKISELMECNTCLKADLAAQLSYFESELTNLKKSFADSETMNSSLNAEILSLNRKADVLTNQLQLSGDELVEVKLRESTLIDKYGTSLKQIDEINKEKAQKEAELSNAVEQLHKFNDMKIEKVSVENELCISKQKISELMECNACLKADLAAQLSHFESELTNLKKSFADSETMNSSLNADILSLNRKADVLTNQLQLSGDELAEVKLRESTLIDKYGTSLKQIDEINKEKAQKEAELSNAVEQLHKFNDMKIEKVSVENELCISKQKISELMECNACLKADLAANLAENEKKISELDETNNQLLSINTCLKADLASNLTDYENKFAELSETINRLENDLNTKINHLAMMKSDKVQIESELRASQEQIVKLTTFNFELKQQIVQIGHLESQLTDLKKSLTESERSNSSLKTEIESLHKNGVVLTDQLKITDDELMETKRRELNLIDELDAASKQINEIRDNRSRMEVKLSDAIEQFDALKSDKACVENELSHSKKQVFEFDELKVELEQQLSQSHSSLNDVEVQLAEMKQLFEEKESDNVSLQSKLLSQSKVNASLTNQLNELNNEMVGLKDYELNLNNKLNAANEHRDEIVKEKSKIEFELAEVIDNLSKITGCTSSSEQIAKLKDYQHKINKLEKNMSAMKKFHEQEKRKLKEEMKAQERRIQCEATLELSNLQKKVLETTSLHSKVVNDIKANETQAVQKLKMEINQSKSKLNKYEDEVINLKSQYTKERNRSSAQEQITYELQEKADQMERENAKLMQELKLLKQRNCSQETQLSYLEEVVRKERKSHQPPTRSATIDSVYNQNIPTSNETSNINIKVTKDSINFVIPNSPRRTRSSSRRNSTASTISAVSQSSVDSAETFRNLPEDEDGQFLRGQNMADLKDGKCEISDSSYSNRLSELSRRNTLCLPHLKSSYPIETQNNATKSYNDEEIKAGKLKLLKHDYELRRQTMAGIPALKQIMDVENVNPNLRQVQKKRASPKETINSELLVTPNKRSRAMKLPKTPISSFKNIFRSKTLKITPRKNVRKIKKVAENLRQEDGASIASISKLAS